MNIKTCITLLVLFFVSNATAFGQEPFPQQFYTNGKAIDGWIKDVQNKRRFIYWFGKNPKEHDIYNQQAIAYVLDQEPGKVYYYNVGTKKFVGRYSYEQDKYGLLPKKFQKEKLEEIEEQMFQPYGEMPAIDFLFPSSSTEGRTNLDKLEVPPPTKEHPRFAKSRWESSFFSNGRTRSNALLEFDGNQGSFRTEENRLGTINQVQYQLQGDAFHITGNWSLGNQGGFFRFRVYTNNLYRFQGEWGYFNQPLSGTWDGSRLR